jgi:hypothetical protein
MPADPFDPSLAELAAEARAAWRDDELEWTSAAYEQWCHGRTLVDRAREHLHRGDRIAVTARPGAVPLAGRVVGVADDALALGTAGGRVDVPLRGDRAVAWRVVERARTGGSHGAAVGGFRARLLELEAAGAMVDVGTAVLDRVACGRLTVGRDHVVVDDGDTVTVIGMGAIDWVRAASGSAE